MGSSSTRRAVKSVDVFGREGAPHMVLTENSWSVSILNVTLDPSISYFILSSLPYPSVAAVTTAGCIDASGSISNLRHTYTVQ